MRKHKSVVAVLLAVMMIFTFMPAMAFADADPNNTWDAANKYASVKDSSGTSFTAYRYFDSAAGYVEAIPQANTTVGGRVTPPTEKAYFYDLDGSTYAYKDGAKYVDLNGKTVEQSYFENTLMNKNQSTLAAKLVEQNYVWKYAVDEQEYKASKAASKGFDAFYVEYDSLDKKYVGYGYMGNYTYEFETSEYDKGSTKDQDVTIKTKKVALSTGSSFDYSDPTTADCIGIVGSVTFKVKGVDTVPATAKFYLDSVDSHSPKTSKDTTQNTDTIVGKYDGAAHTVVCDEVPGYTVSYEIKNQETGKWSAGTPSVTKAGSDNAVVFRAIFAKNGSTTKVTTKEITLSLAHVSYVWSVGFVTTDQYKGAQTTTYSANYKVSGTEYNPADYIDALVIPVSGATDQLAEEKAAATKAIAANKTELMSFFNDFFEVKNTTPKGEKEYVELTIVPKAFGSSDAEQKAKRDLQTKYADLMANFGIPKDKFDTALNFMITGTSEVVPVATIELNADAVVDDEIEFTNAVTSKVYKGKKTTKKGKLKKDQSFTVKAVSNEGKTVSYKLINASTPKISIDKTTGKITVKKGLTKGTYKFTVKAYTTGKYGSETSEYQDIKVRIKK